MAKSKESAHPPSPVLDVEHYTVWFGGVASSGGVAVRLTDLANTMAADGWTLILALPFRTDRDDGGYYLLFRRPI